MKNFALIMVGLIGLGLFSVAMYNINEQYKMNNLIADTYKKREANCTAKDGVWLKIDQNVTPGIADICYGNDGLIEFHVW